MQEDDELCLCFHVTRRKVLQFIRVEKPQRASQLSGCFGAGTGCGWCRPVLRKLMEQRDPAAVTLPDRDEYARQRREYRKQRSRQTP
ncbi:MAG: bacterioferritin-associated ferredoxin [Novipirellula sp. JB048]